MAITTPGTASDVLTYEQYMTEGVLHRRYDIIDGVRILMPAPSWRHQRIQGKAVRVLEEYEEQTGAGYALGALFDVLIRRVPRLQTRQPDALFITRARLEQGGGPPSSGPLEVPPELVIEIISDSETESRLDAKLADYVQIGVNEAWLVRAEIRTVEVVRLTPDGPVTVAAYGVTETLHSFTFPDLTVSVATLFSA